MEKIINLNTNDNKIYKLEYKYLQYSILINVLFDNDNNFEETINLLNVDGKSFESIEYMLRYYYKLGDDNKNFRNDVNISDYIIKLSIKDLFNLISSVHYLDIPILEDILCDRVGDIISSKSKDELEKMFNIKLKINNIS